MSRSALIILISHLLITRYSWAQSNANYVFGKGIKFESDDCQIALKSRIQSLYFVSTDPATFKDALESGIQVRRARIKMDGTATSNFSFKFEFALSNRDISSPIPENSHAANIVLDAIIMYKPTANTQIWFGQTKLPGNRERVISSQDLQFVDRSLLNSYFNIDRDMGIQIRNKSKIFGKSVVNQIFSISQGEGRNITAGNFGGYDYTARLEFLPFGEFSKKGDYTSSSVNYVKGEKNEDDGKLSFAAGFDFNNGTSRSAGQLGKFIMDSLNNYTHADITTLFIDAIYKYKRVSYLGEFAQKKSKGDATYSGLYYTGWSYNNQIGCMLTSKSELSARHTHVNGNLSKIVDMYTLGFSRYISKHNLKFQTDFSLIDKGGNNPEMLFRFQTEISF